MPNSYSGYLLDRGGTTVVGKEGGVGDVVGGGGRVVETIEGTCADIPVSTAYTVSLTNIHRLSALHHLHQVLYSRTFQLET